MYKTTNNSIARELTEVLAQKNVQHAVISPGSRNAPLIVAFNRHPEINCYAVPDERSAAFFAIGLALFLDKPVAIVCTSGTAVLNYAPALAEAFYQKIPLIAITADRPPEWIDMADSQAIRQHNIYANYTKASYQLPTEAAHPDDLWYANRVASAAVNRAMEHPRAAVHINVPFREPLYGQEIHQAKKTRIITTVATEAHLPEDALSELANLFNQSQKVMILLGQCKPDQKLEAHLNQLSNFQQCIVLTETTGNMHGTRFISCIDRTLSAMPDMEIDKFSPDLLITMGGAVVSKRIKSFLRKNRPHHHWHISESDHDLDTYQALTLNIPVADSYFWEQLTPKIQKRDSDFSLRWQEISGLALKKHRSYLKSLPYCDLKVFEQIIAALPEKSVVHYSNSTPIRYAQLFEHSENVICLSNRGTSGIDGSTSTAAGYAMLSGKINLLVTGDIGFFYDSNALWNNYLKANFKIILINNGGGNIFRYIPGPAQTAELETFFETRQTHSAKPLATGFGLEYYKAENLLQLQTEFEKMLKNDQKPAILEVFTPNKLNANTLIQYFEYIKL